MRIIGVVQARLGSTRLPRKIMKTLPFGDRGREEPMLRFLLERLTRSHYLDLIVVATPQLDREEIAQEAALRVRPDPCPIEIFAPDVPEDDLVARHAAVAREYDADLVVRVPSDNPFVDPFVADLAVLQALEYHKETRRCHTSLEMVGPLGIVDGLGAEVYSRALIESLDRCLGAGTEDREHPIRVLKRDPLSDGTRGVLWPHWRHGPMALDVNTPADLERMRRIAAYMVERHGPHFSARQLNAAPHEVLA